MKKLQKSNARYALILGLVLVSGLLTAACPMVADDALEDSASPLSSVNPTKVWKIGDKGPAGGIIFYAPDPDDPNKCPSFEINGVIYQYLEAAPADLAPSIWGLNEINTRKTEGTIGKGKTNTLMLIAEKIEDTSAAGRCYDYRGGGKSDWYLPSYKEVELMFKNLCKAGKGNFLPEYYWSSTEYGHNTARGQKFDETGCQEQGLFKADKHRVRPVRAF